MAATVEPNLTAGGPLDDIRLWIQNPANFAHIMQAQGLQGGWEVWAQVELAFHLINRWVASHTILREQRVYNTNNILDLWCTALTPGAPPANVNRNRGIELKCRSFRETSATFVNRVVADMDLIMDPPRDANCPCALYALAFSTNLPDLQGWDAAPKTVWYHPVVDVTGVTPGTVYMIWVLQVHELL